MRIRLDVNGGAREIEAREHESLLTVLRDQLGLIGSKDACEQGECGSCSVLMDGDLVCSCLVMSGARLMHDGQVCAHFVCKLLRLLGTADVR